MSADHTMALGAVLFLPVGLVLLLAVLQRAAPRWNVAAGVERRLTVTPAPVRAAALLLLTSAAVHASLVPQHLQDESATAFLFVVDAVALVVASASLVIAPRAQGLTALLLIAGIAAYGGYLLSGLEHIDAVGVTTKVVEAGALALLLNAHRRGHRDPAHTALSYAVVNPPTSRRT